MNAPLVAARIGSDTARHAARIAAAALALAAAPAAADDGLLGLPPGVGLGILVGGVALMVGFVVWGVRYLVQARRHARLVAEDLVAEDEAAAARRRVLSEQADERDLTADERHELDELKKVPRGAAERAGLKAGIEAEIAREFGIVLWLLPGLPPEVRVELWALHTENRALALDLIDVLAEREPDLGALRERIADHYPELTTFIETHLSAPPEALAAARRRLLQDDPALDRLTTGLSNDGKRLRRLDPRDPETGVQLLDIVKRVSAARRQLDDRLQLVLPLSADEAAWAEQFRTEAEDARLQAVMPTAFDADGRRLGDPRGQLGSADLDKLDWLVQGDMTEALTQHRLHAFHEARNRRRKTDQLEQLAAAQQALAEQAADGSNQGLQQQEQALTDLAFQIEAIDPASPNAADWLTATQRQLDQVNGADVQQSQARDRQVQGGIDKVILGGRGSTEEEEHKVYREPSPTDPKSEPSSPRKEFRTFPD